MGLKVKCLLLSAALAIFSTSLSLAQVADGADAGQGKKIPTTIIIETSNKQTGLLFNSFYPQELASFIQKKLPQNQILVIRSSERDFIKAQVEIQKKLASTTNDSTYVTQLIFITNAEVFQDHEAAQNKVVLFGLGSIFENNVSTTFDQTFSSIKNKVAANATVIFDTCGTVCATDSLAISFSKSIAKFFSITDGSIFASRINNSFALPLENGSLFKAKQILYPLAIGAALASVLSPMMFDGSLADFAMTWSSLTAATTLLGYPLSFVSDIIKRAKAQVMNKGVLLNIRAEEVSTPVETKKLKWYAKGFPQEATPTSTFKLKSCDLLLSGKQVL
jgi:hypothetical protein